MYLRDSLRDPAESWKKLYWSEVSHVKLWLGAFVRGEPTEIHSQLPILNCRLETGFYPLPGRPFLSSIRETLIGFSSDDWIGRFITLIL